MVKRPLQMAFSLLFVTTLSSCGSGGDSALTANGSSAQLPSTSSVLTHTTAVAAATTLSSIDINSGGGTVTGGWLADTDYSTSGSNGAYVVSKAIDTSKATDPAPQSVYQSQRFGTTLTYVIPDFSPGASYNVRLHFAETYFKSANKRLFNVTINGVKVLSNFDIYAITGGADIALVEAFTTTADASGKITVAMAASVNNATIAGIQIALGSGSPSPSPIPSSSPSPVPSTTPTSSGSMPNAYSACLAPGCANTGPRVAVGPQTAITCPAGSVNISAGTSIQSVVNAHSAGTAYCFGVGTFTNQSVVPQTGDTYTGQGSSTILNGEDSTNAAFSGSATGVHIQNFVLTHYANSAESTGTIYPNRGTVGWHVNNMEISFAHAVGLIIDGDVHGSERYGGEGATAVANYVHDNTEEGYRVWGDNIKMTDNIFYHNNPAGTTDCNVECGGGKASETLNLNMSYNYSYNNLGPGMWTDIDNFATTYSYNDVEKNALGGIYHEISWSGEFDYNYAAGNAWTNAQTGALGIACGPSNKPCMEIGGENSGGEPGKVIDISYNVVKPTSTNSGIAHGCLSGRGSSGTWGSTYGPWITQNIKIHNNWIVQANGGFQALGIQDYCNLNSTIWANDSMNSDHFYNASGTQLVWGTAQNENQKVNFAGLQALGQELNGTSANGQLP